MKLSVSAKAALILVLLVGSPLRAENYRILEQQLDAQRQGYTIIHVWGTHRQMGEALGRALADDILAGLDQVKSRLGNLYDTTRTVIADTHWPAAGILDELDGMVEGVRSVRPQAALDRVDLMIVNTYGDWGYYGGCRSHQCWGSFLTAPARTLATRRLDFGTPFEMVLHHVIVAFEPEEGERWVNVAWPGYVAVITGVNAHGTLVSLHDYESRFEIVSGAVPRCIATRRLLSDVPAALPVARHLDWAESELGGFTLTTGTFINFYAPEGLGGVFTCVSGGKCSRARRPQAAYFDGEVLMTTNSQTDGTGVPGGGEFMDEYYRQGKPKSLQDHFELMGTSGLHLLSVEYRGQEDMTLWFIGRGMSRRLELEWAGLFEKEPRPDGADADSEDGRDAGEDAGPDAGSGDAADSGAADPADDTAPGDQPTTTETDSSPSSSCSHGREKGPALPVLGLLVLVMLVRRRKR